MLSLDGWFCALFGAPRSAPNISQSHPSKDCIASIFIFSSNFRFLFLFLQVQYLLAYGADHNYVVPGGSSVLMVAVNSGKTDHAAKLDIVKLLTQDLIVNDEEVFHGCDVNVVAGTQKFVALHFASMDGSTELVNYMLDIGAWIDAADIDGMVEERDSNITFVISCSCLRA